MGDILQQFDHKLIGQIGGKISARATILIMTNHCSSRFRLL